MTAPLVFLDTETTGLALDDDIWEVAAIRRETDGRETAHRLFLKHSIRKCERLPDSFRRDHELRYDPDDAVYPGDAAAYLDPLLSDGRPHIVGAVPNFDTERIALLLRAHGFEPGWHYHPIDVETLAVGYLRGTYVGAQQAGGIEPLPGLLSLPWDSDDLSRQVGVEPPTDTRHTALGDAQWARAIYDQITNPTAIPIGEQPS